MVTKAYRNGLFLGGALLGGLLCLGGANAASSTAVIELFTSQGCSSCPPADRLIEQMSHDPGVIAVSLPVDYWDYLGWKDTFAKPQFSQRQRAYAAARGDGQVYTPQAVINGRIHANGTSRSEISAAISETAGAIDIAVTLKRAGGDVDVTVAADNTGQARRSGTILAMPIIAHREVAIGRGENARSTVAYTNIAREVIPIGTWSGSKVSARVPASAIADADGVVVILQTATPGNPGPILAAAQLALK